MSLSNSPFLAACRGEKPERTPIWIMRQAGRYLPEYRKLREKVDFLTLTKTPELAAEATMQPIRRFGMDAAILFSDIMTPLEGMGIELEFAPGPIISRPIRRAGDVDRLHVADPEESIPFVMEAIRIVRREIPETPLIGFAGAPWTLFCYLVQGSGSKNFARARAFLMSEERAASSLLDILARTVASSLEAQARAGAQALMIFDSWAGLLDEGSYRRFCLPALSLLRSRLQENGLPLIYFPYGGAHFLEAVAELGFDVVGLDWRSSLTRARAVLGPKPALQGNLDPAALFAPRKELIRRAEILLDEARNIGPHIFNLGHGIERDTEIAAVEALVETVHNYGTAGGHS